MSYFLVDFKDNVLRFIACLVLLSAGTPVLGASRPSVTIQLRWHAQFQFAGYYVALAKGFYREAGYDITIVEGAPGRSPVNEVLVGHAQYGEANSELLYWRLHGRPLVALAVIGQHSPSVMLAGQDSHIRTPQDMIGKRVMMVRTGEASDDADFMAMLHNEGVDPAKVRIIDSSYEIEDLISGKTDVFNAYLTNEPYYLKRRGVPVSIIKPITYGIDFYSDVLFTTERELESHPGRVAAIREATLRGWRYAMDHPEEVIDLLIDRFGARKSRDHLRYEANALRELFLPDLIDIGHMNPGRWAHMADVFANQGLVDRDYSLDGFLYDPDPSPDLRWVWGGLSVLGALFTVAAAVAVTLLFFNKRLQLEVVERREAESRLRRSEDDLRAIINKMQDVFYRTDAAGVVTMVSPSCLEAFGYSSAELVGQPLEQFYYEPDERSRFLVEMKAAGGSLLGYEVRLRHRDGSIRWASINAQYVTDARGQFIGVEGTARDITERKHNETFIERQAYYDALTDLPNRRMVLERLRYESVRSRRHGHYGALMFLDLDNFKTINDSLGHLTGDRLLWDVAARLREMVREEDTAARLGGDEFVVLMVELDGHSEEAGNIVRHAAERLRQRLSEPYRIDGRQLFTSPSIGITLFPAEDEDTGPEELLKQADIAMYRAKAHGKNGVAFYLPAMQKAAVERLALENSLRQALEGHQLALYYQVQVDAERHVIGAEALLRWLHPVDGMIPPGSFIPVAEESGLILEVGEWVVQEACRQLRAWLDAGILPEGFRLSVNVSPRQFHQKHFVDQMAHHIQAHAIPPEHLDIELTEGTLLNHIDDAIAKMNALKSLGIHLSIDDFGTGYSSLAYLKRLPLDVLKIDRSFVCDINTDVNDATIVETIVFMTRQLGMEAVAEGVESEEILLALNDLGCRFYQGYHFGRPLPADEFVASLPALQADSGTRVGLTGGGVGS